MSDDRKRQQLASTFDRAAERYQRARPEYPDELFDHLIDLTELRPDSRLLEIGCATGKATLPLARRGYRITCIEPGRALASEARRALAHFDVEIIETRFEDWDDTGARYSLVYAATAWHWLDPSVGYQQAARILQPEGFLAIWGAGHVIAYDGDPFFEEIQEVYDEIGETLPPDSPLPRPQELDDDRAQIEASGLFDVLDVRQFDWETTYDAEGYIDLLSTFSGHIAMNGTGSSGRSAGGSPSALTVDCVATGAASSTSPGDDTADPPHTTGVVRGHAERLPGPTTTFCAFHLTTSDPRGSCFLSSLINQFLTVRCHRGWG